MKIALISIGCWLGFLVFGYAILNQMVKDGSRIMTDNTTPCIQKIIPSSYKTSWRIWATIVTIISGSLVAALPLMPKTWKYYEYIPFAIAFLTYFGGAICTASKIKEIRKWKQTQS